MLQKVFLIDRIFTEVVVDGIYADLYVTKASLI